METATKRLTVSQMYLGLDRAHFLSPSGQCKAFDASADGYCRSEGCGIFVLKRLSDALQESDNILGVIKGIEINQSGNADSITHPHAPTQEQLFKKLFSKADIDPLRVSVVVSKLNPRGGNARTTILNTDTMKGSTRHRNPSWRSSRSYKHTERFIQRP